jgi:hypothetical protein
MQGYQRYTGRAALCWTPVSSFGLGLGGSNRPPHFEPGCSHAAPSRLPIAPAAMTQRAPPRPAARECPLCCLAWTNPRVYLLGDTHVVHLTPLCGPAFLTSSARAPMCAEASSPALCVRPLADMAKALPPPINSAMAHGTTRTARQTSYVARCSLPRVDRCYTGWLSPPMIVPWSVSGVRLR